MATKSQPISHLATGMAIYDEGRLESGTVFTSTHGWKRPKRWLQFLRSRKGAACLLIADLIIVGRLLILFGPLISLLRRNEELFGPRVALSQYTLEAGHHSRRQIIPRILHQTSASHAIPEKWVRSQHSCKEAYVGFEYKLWTDELSRDFLASEYPWFLDRWNSYPFPIQRADSIRYFILHHYGGIYLDMDTFCNATFPLDQVESDTPLHTAVFKSTVPTGVSNDFMITSARHPAFAAAISKLPIFYDITRSWARLQPYCNIMIAAGPFFITWVVKDYLLQQPSLPSSTIQVVNSTQLTPYITDLESSSWHQADAPALMWLGQRPWAWFGLAVVGLVSGLHVSNQVFLMVCGAFLHKVPSVIYQIKQAKVT